MTLSPDEVSSAWRALTVVSGPNLYPGLSFRFRSLFAIAAGQENLPDPGLAVQQISAAINALVANDLMTCLRHFEFASRTIGNPLD